MSKQQISDSVYQNPVKKPSGFLISEEDVNKSFAGLSAKFMQSISLDKDEIRQDLRAYIAYADHYVRYEFEQKGASGYEAACLRADLCDRVIKLFFLHTLELFHVSYQDDISLIATGFYGSGALAPFDEPEITFLCQDEKAVQKYRLALGFFYHILHEIWRKIDASCYTPEEALARGGQDNKLRLNLFGTRLVTGSEPLFKDFRKQFCQIHSKELYRDLHKRYNIASVSFVTEPDILSDYGGLYDLYKLYKLAHHLHEVPSFEALSELRIKDEFVFTPSEARHAKRALSYLWTTRFHLHYITEHAEEVLHTDIQPIIGARLGYTHHTRNQNGLERFMRHYFLITRSVIQLSYTLEAALAEQKPTPCSETLPEGIGCFDDMIGFTKEVDLSRRPEFIFPLLLTARECQKTVHPRAIRDITRNAKKAAGLKKKPQAARYLGQLLCSDLPGQTDGARWMRLLNVTGFLSHYLPEWAHIIGYIRFEANYTYALDNYAINTIAVLNRLEQEDPELYAPLAKHLLKHNEPSKALYAAPLFHAVLRGHTPGLQTTVDETMKQLGALFALTEEETEMASWLALHHSVLRQAAFTKDIDSPQVIFDLTETVQSPERLRLLLILTIAGSYAVSSYKVWNNWKSSVMRELYTRIFHSLAGGLLTETHDARIDYIKNALKQTLTDWSKEELLTFLDSASPSYWLAFDIPTHAHHANFMRQADRNKTPVSVTALPFGESNFREILLYAPVNAAFFSHISAALTFMGISVLGARVHTMKNGKALYKFWAEAKTEVFADSDFVGKILTVLTQSADKNFTEKNLKKLNKLRPLSRKKENLTLKRRFPARVIFNNHESETHTIIEVNGYDEPGFLYRVVSQIAGQGRHITSAHIATYGIQAIDIFYVTDKNYKKITDKEELSRLKKDILSALTFSEK